MCQGIQVMFLELLVKTYFLNHTQDVVPRLLAKHIQWGIMLNLECDTLHRLDKNTILKTLDVLVSIYNYKQNIVETPSSKPQKDYDDYTKYVNEEFVARK